MKTRGFLMLLVVVLFWLAPSPTPSQAQGKRREIKPQRPAATQPAGPAHWSK